MNNAGKWNDRPCQMPYSYACEVPVGVAAATLPLGCADGSVEANFEDPNVVGCVVHAWKGVRDLRAASTGTPCGNDIKGECASLNDACDADAGWSVCQRASQLEMVQNTECDHLVGMYAIGMSHTTPNGPDCHYSDDQGCQATGFGAEAACCGKDCQLGNCKDA